MRRLFFAGVLVVHLALLAGYAQAWSGSVGLLYGQKSLSSSDWKIDEVTRTGNLAEHTMYGLHADIADARWPVRAALAIIGSDATQVLWANVADANTLEIQAGVKKIWDLEFPVEPYVAGGLAHISGTIKEGFTRQTSESDSAIGYWINAGLYWRFSRLFSAGVDFRYSSAKITLYDQTFDAGGRHMALSVNYHW